MNTVFTLRLLLRPITAPLQVSKTQARKMSWFNWGKSKDGDSAPQTTSRERSITDLLKRSPRAASALQQAPERGRLGDTSIFGKEDVSENTTSRELDLTAMRAIRDPHRSSWGWPKLQASREMRRRGRLSRRQRILQTERSHTAASHFFRTSMKKLAPLARQIMGKRLEDAVTQMRFSPKKAARDVLAHLHYARNEAVVRKAMDPALIYISEAWVGKGPYEKALSHRARGRIDILMTPHTSMHSILSLFLSFFLYGKWFLLIYFFKVLHWC
jgi:ribosomal protein L22